MLRAVCIGAAVVLGVLALANGLYMLAAPSRWYFAVPGVTTTGPFNQHFIRDIGLIFLLIGTMFVAGARKPGHRVLLWGVPTLWLCGHALFHLWEVAVGVSGHSAMTRDFPAVTLPGLIGVLITWWAARERRIAKEGK